MSEKRRKTTHKELEEAVKATILKPRENPAKYENREPTKEELNKRFSLKRRHDTA